MIAILSGGIVVFVVRNGQRVRHFRVLHEQLLFADDIGDNRN